MKAYILFFSAIIFFFLTACQKEKHDPDITIVSADPISASSCKATAKINVRGSYAITDHGFVYAYGTTTLPYVNSTNKISLGETMDKDTFSAVVTLNTSGYYSSNTTCTVWSYITNEKGTVYSKNSVSFVPLNLTLNSIYPSEGRAGDTITITGNNFDLVKESNTVQLYYNYNTYNVTVVSASKTKLKFIIPTISSSYNSDNYSDVVVKAGGQTYTLYDVLSILPTVTGFYPNTGTFGTSITISGANFTGSYIYMDDLYVGSYSTYANSVVLTVPSNLTKKTFKLYVQKGSKKIEVPGGQFTLNAMTVSSYTPSSAYLGNSSSITVNGTNFNSSYYYNYLIVGTTKISANYGYPSTTQVSAYLPGNLPAGNYPLYVCNGADTLEIDGGITVAEPTITSISPLSGAAGVAAIISGDGFGNYNGNINVKFGSTYATVSTVNNKQINVVVPTLGKGSWIVTIYVNGYACTKTLTYTIP